MTVQDVEEKRIGRADGGGKKEQELGYSLDLHTNACASSMFWQCCIFSPLERQPSCRSGELEGGKAELKKAGMQRAFPI